MHIRNKWLTFVNLKMLLKNIFVKITKIIKIRMQP